ncbi:hypothetical protein [Kribbella sp. NPDC004536]|uniref:hypothetical protein n=1 Tax=Kribbella sp. NPDC004536 TaxID=3364106 RepID=UPI0036A70CEE
MSALTPRERAYDCFHLARSASTRVPLGGQRYGMTIEGVRRNREDLFRQAERAVTEALNGPPKVILREPDDDALRAMLAVCGRELAASNEEAR